MPRRFSGNLIFALIARMLCGNHLNIFVSQMYIMYKSLEKKASEKIGEKCFLSPHFAHTFSLAVFRAMPQLTERLEETNLFLVTHVSIIFRPKSFSGREQHLSGFLLCYALKTFKYCVSTLLYFQIEISNFLLEKILNSIRKKNIAAVAR